MRQTLALLAVAVLALAVQGLLAALLPAFLVPDLTLLGAVAAAVVLPPLPGLLLAAGLGYGADVLSSSLLGQHGLVRIFAYSATVVISSQFQLRRGSPLFFFVLLLAFIDVFLVDLVGRVFGELRGAGLWAAGAAASRALVTAALAPLAVARMEQLRERLQEGDARRREVRLETRRPVL